MPSAHLLSGFADSVGGVTAPLPSAIEADAPLANCYK